MAQIVKIKRSNTTAVPSTLTKGEMAYSSNSHKLFIGQPGDSSVEVIGGKLYVDMLDHAAGTLTNSSALITDSGGKLDQLKVDNLTFNGNTISSTDTNGDININPNGTGNLTTSGDLIVAGDFTVNGTTTTVNTSTMTVEDPLLALASDNTATDSVDIGFYGLYDTSGSQDAYSGLFRDATDKKWHLFKDNQAAPGTTVNKNGTGYEIATIVAHLEDSSIAITGGSITGITDLTVSDGGTGRSSFTADGILYGDGTSGIKATAAGTDGYLLVSNSGTPTWTSTVDGGTF
tara:strand:- start:758 stop:1624 length:867 start_codon:yes stop_codon:yes gene_type:complete